MQHLLHWQLFYFASSLLRRREWKTHMRLLRTTGGVPQQAQVKHQTQNSTGTMCVFPAVQVPILQRGEPDGVLRPQWRALGRERRRLDLWNRWNITKISNKLVTHSFYCAGDWAATFQEAKDFWVDTSQFWVSQLQKMVRCTSSLFHVWQAPSLRGAELQWERGNPWPSAHALTWPSCVDKTSFICFCYKKVQTCIIPVHQLLQTFS